MMESVLTAQAHTVAPSAVESDLAASLSPSPSASPEPAVDDHKPAKKRRSWGQELPVPKTNLPPRYACLSDIPLRFDIPADSFQKTRQD